jgi:hypothetical protein
MMSTRKKQAVVAAAVAVALIGGSATALLAHGSTATGAASTAADTGTTGTDPADTGTVDTAAPPVASVHAAAAPAAGPAPPKPAGPATSHRRPSVAIPARAMLQSADLGGAGTQPGDSEYAAHLKPPMPCGAAAHQASTRKLVAEREIRALTALHGPDGPDSVMENVARYRGNGATLYYGELLAGIRNCDTADTTWSVVSRPGYGDASVVVKLAESGLYAGSEHVQVTYLGVARVGDLVVTVVDLGWETSGGDAAVAGQLLERGVARADNQ